MTPKFATIVFGIALFAGAAAIATAAARATTVWDGVYTEAQARRGGNVYVDHCAECHADDLSGQTAYKPSPALVGSDFRARWDAKTLDVLFELIRTRMPKQREGALDRKDYVEVVAFILQANRFPASSTELPGDVDGLRQVRLLKERTR
jgi:cytochrome c